MPTREDLIQDINDLEQALERLEYQPDIWQNKIIKCLCRAVWHLLQAQVRRTK